MNKINLIKITNQLLKLKINQFKRKNKNWKIFNNKLKNRKNLANYHKMNLKILITKMK